MLFVLSPGKACASDIFGPLVSTHPLPCHSFPALPGFRFPQFLTLIYTAFRGTSFVQRWNAASWDSTLTDQQIQMGVVSPKDAEIVSSQNAHSMCLHAVPVIPSPA